MGRHAAADLGRPEAMLHAAKQACRPVHGRGIGLQRPFHEQETAGLEARQQASKSGGGIRQMLKHIAKVNHIKKLAGVRTIVSTATRTLQDQLFQVDLPRVQAALKSAATVALLTVDQSYISSIKQCS